MTEVVDRASSAQQPAGRKEAASGADPVVDVAALGEQLLGKWAHIRHEARKVAGNPVVQKIEGLHHTEHRARVFEQLKFLVDNNTVHRASQPGWAAPTITAATSPVSKRSLQPTPPFRSRPASSGGASSAPLSCTSARRNIRTSGSPAS